MADMEEDSDKAQEQGQSPRSTSKLIERKMLNDYKYAIRTMKQTGNYNKITTYLILHISKKYEHGGDITNAIEKQEPFNLIHLHPD